jgi:hypothetical protein
MTQTETDLKKWQQQQARFQNIFGNDAILDKGFQKIKLLELEKIYQKNKGTADPLEKATLQWLKAGNKHIEKQLYPHFRQRLWRLIVSAARNSIPEEPRQQTKPKEAQANQAGQSWMEQHVFNRTDARQSGKADNKSAQTKSTAKTPRVRISESENHAIRMSR